MDAQAVFLICTIWGSGPQAVLTAETEVSRAEYGLCTMSFQGGFLKMVVV